MREASGIAASMAGTGAALSVPAAGSTLRRLNVNVGVLGHIDSGKTALARALSTVASTAAFDRAPQSRARGITLDLGFSCLCTELPPHLGLGPGQLQLTLVDCPGHASLIRTIIGGKKEKGESNRLGPPGSPACTLQRLLGLGNKPCQCRGGWAWQPVLASFSFSAQYSSLH